MPSALFKKAGLLALTITFFSLAGWEFYLRHRYFQGDNNISAPFDDNEALWAYTRGQVYEPSDQATVFIGSSRIKYDLDIPTWKAITGNHAVQLANVGSSPRPVLEDLASDPHFKGRLIIDVTEGLFFSENNTYDGSTNKKIAYFKNLNPTQRFSFQVNRILESQFVFLDQDNFSINAMLDNAHLFGYREGVFPGVFFPRGFEQVSFERQSYMTADFVADTNQQVIVRNIWARSIARAKKGPPPVSGSALDSVLYSVKNLLDKIKARGGQVIFVRTPSSGPLREAEVHAFPRTAYWDKLIAVTGCPGIYFEDYPAIAHLICPEWSHLKPADGVIYTKTLIAALEEKGWLFKKAPL